MKELYENTELEIIRFSAEDVVMTSESYPDSCTNDTSHDLPFVAG